jgi:predicted Zn-dependent protease
VKGWVVESTLRMTSQVLLGTIALSVSRFAADMGTKLLVEAKFFEQKRVRCMRVLNDEGDHGEEDSRSCSIKFASVARSEEYGVRKGGSGTRRRMNENDANPLRNGAFYSWQRRVGLNVQARSRASHGCQQ